MNGACRVHVGELPLSAHNECDGNGVEYFWVISIDLDGSHGMLDCKPFGDLEFNSEEETAVGMRIGNVGMRKAILGIRFNCSLQVHQCRGNVGTVPQRPSSAQEIVKSGQAGRRLATSMINHVSLKMAGHAAG